MDSNDVALLSRPCSERHTLRNLGCGGTSSGSAPAGSGGAAIALHPSVTALQAFRPRQLDSGGLAAAGPVQAGLAPTALDIALLCQPRTSMQGDNVYNRTNNLMQKVALKMLALVKKCSFSSASGLETFEGSTAEGSFVDRAVAGSPKKKSSTS